ncbi:MAG: type II toxin-antitoxin system ParD family antitoxin [Pyrinomonadaceae bacterium]|nr:type II toxin-antitoxin system ParD family antitoxin [Pyrinomonadaceae bacterium]
MNVSLTPELEAMVQEKVKSGDYNSASEVVREALRLLKQHDEYMRIKREELRSEIMKGVSDIREGKSTVYASAEELVADVIKRGMENRE